MDNITKRLHENRQIELAKSILEANGYEVSKIDEAKDEKYIIVGITSANNDRVYYNAKDDTFSKDREDATIYAEYDIVLGDWMDISRTGFKRIFIALDTDVSKDAHFEESVEAPAEDLVSKVKKALDDASISYTAIGKNKDRLVVRREDLEKASEIRDEIDPEYKVTVSSRA